MARPASALRTAMPVALAPLLMGLLLGCGGSSSTSTNPGNGNPGPGQPGPGLATWILVGGAAKPAGANLYLDPYLDPGELFIIPQSPLGVNASYQIAITAVAGGETFTHTWSFTTGGMYIGLDPIANLNGLRGESGVGPLASNAACTTAATKHAGYQAIENGDLTHVEPDAGNALFVAYAFDVRINDANGGPNDWLGTVEAENVGSLGGTSGIALLWNTVYHRLPMMRSTTTMVGYGDRNAAQSAYPSAKVPAASAAGSTGWAYATLDFAGDVSAPILASHWPADGAADVSNEFDNTAETPQPIGGPGNLNDSTGNPGMVGVPIDFICPTSANFTSITATLTAAP